MNVASRLVNRDPIWGIRVPIQGLLIRIILKSRSVTGLAKCIRLIPGKAPSWEVSLLGHRRELIGHHVVGLTSYGTTTSLEQQKVFLRIEFCMSDFYCVLYLRNVYSF